MLLVAEAPHPTHFSHSKIYSLFIVLLSSLFGREEPRALWEGVRHLIPSATKGETREPSMMDSANNNNRRCITLREVVHIDYWSTLPQELLPLIVSHWDVATLIDRQRVCRDWKDLCTDAINAKRTETTQVAFTTNEELKQAVKHYCRYNEYTYQYSQRCSRQDAEEIATAYGWPINKWDVSSLQDLSGIFRENRGFNEDIGLWNTLSAKSMRDMFFYANAFDRMYPLGTFQM
jgi:hypothetical protein